MTSSIATNKEFPPIREETRGPPVRNGDRLTRDGFERRDGGGRLPPGFKAELIDNVVYIKEPVFFRDSGDMASPVSRRHGSPNFNINGWLYDYQKHTSG